MTVTRPARSTDRPGDPSGAAPVIPPRVAPVLPPDAVDGVVAQAPVARLSVIVPVYNERNTLPELLSRVTAQPLSWHGRPVELEVVVVNDCSNDGGVDFLEQPEGRLTFPEVRLIHHPRNLGKGAAIRTGLGHATGQVVLIQDADLEYDPSDYGKLLAPILDGQTRVVYGSRFKGRPLWAPLPGMHPANWACNRLLSLAATLLFFRPVTDEATCYKVMDRTLVDDLDLQAERFDICPEITSKVLRRGLTIVEVPIKYRGRGTNEGKKIRWTDAFHAIYTLLRYRFSD